MSSPENDGPGVSVIIPAFNAASTILETLRSVSAQTYGDFEIIVVDDGSRDDTAEVVERYAQGEPRLRLLRQTNAGAAAARNLAIRDARAPFIAPIDADDLWYPRRLERHMAVLARADGVGFVYSPFRLIDVDGRVSASHPRFDFEGRVFCRQLFFNMVGNGSGMTFDRAAALRVGGYDNALREAGAEGCEDWLLQMRISAEYPVACAPEYLIGYRRSPTAMSADIDKIWRSRLFAADLLKACTDPARQALIETAKLHFAVRQALVSLRHANLGLLSGAIGGAVGKGVLPQVIGEVREALARAARARTRRSRAAGPHFLEVNPDAPGDEALTPYTLALIEQLRRADESDRTYTGQEKAPGE